MARKKNDAKAKSKTDIGQGDITQKHAPTPFTRWKYILALFGFLLYAHTATFDYALDDKIVIINNQITLEGIRGAFGHFIYDSMDGFWAQEYGIPVANLDKDALVSGGRYRPLSLFTYALEWEWFGRNPGVSHLINAILYGITGAVLFMLLCALFPPKGAIWKSIPFWVTLLFLSHPLHVEVIANIKSRDEILSLLFGILALKYVLIFSDSMQRNNLLKAGCFLFLSLLSKETTIAFVAIGPLMLYFFSKGNSRVWKQSFVALFIAAFAYTTLRFMVIGSTKGVVIDELMNNPFLHALGNERLATIFLILFVYVKLLFFPFPLTHDYYPFHLPFLPQGMHYAELSSLPVLMGLAIILILLYVSWKGFASKNIYAFLALFFLATSILISNLFFPIGVFMNERFMYIPSISFAILFVYLCLKVIPQWKYGFPASIGRYILFIVVIGFSILSVNRSFAWENDYTLSLTDVETSLGSAKAKMGAANAILFDIDKETDTEIREEQINLAFTYLSESLEIHPDYFPPLDLLGKLYFETGDYTESVKWYGFCARQKPNDPKFVNNMLIVANKMMVEKQYPQAVDAFKQVLVYRPNQKEVLLALGKVLASDMKRPTDALVYMEKAYVLYPDDIEVVEKTAITYAMKGQMNRAIEILLPLSQKNPNNLSVLKNLAVSFYQIGDVKKSNAIMEQVKDLEANNSGS